MTGTPVGEPDVEAFGQHRRLLFTVAYSILGTAADAEDAVQDSWLRWSASSRAEVRDPRAYLVQVVTRVALTRLRAARSQRAAYVGPWLPGPLLTEGDTTVDQVETREAISMALLVVLETLSPLERGVFVLREVFGYSHREIAEILDSTEGAVRQASSRARAHVRARRPRFPTDDRLHRDTTTRFFRACQTGQVDELLALLAPEVVLVSDGGGKVRAALQPVVGAGKVARLCVALATAGVPGLRMEIRQVNHLSGVVAWVDDQPFAVVQLQTSAEGVDRVDLVRNPDKLSAVAVSTSTGPFGRLSS